MVIYQVCVCGWISEPYPDGTMFMGFGGQLSCPECTPQKRNWNIEVYGFVETVNDGELVQLKTAPYWRNAFEELVRNRIKKLNEERKKRDFEEVEDMIRRRKNKSRRYGGKYKGRGKEKLREP